MIDVSNPRDLLVVGVVFTLLLTAVALGLMQVVLRSRYRWLRVSLAVLFVILLVTSPLMLSELVELFNPTRGVNRVFVHPGWMLKFGPAVVALVVAVLASLKLPGPSPIRRR